jgi:hypothetical protein
MLSNNQCTLVNLHCFSTTTVDGASLCQEDVPLGCRVAGGGPGK